MQSALRIGTRGSPLALAQARETRRRLMAAMGWPEDAIAIEVIKTTGDMVRDRPLSDLGGKGLFTREIEEALLDGRVDLAVHSGKDVPTEVPPGLMLAAFLPREDVRDAFVSPVAASLETLPPGAVLGTSSLRRKAMALRLRPDLQVVEFRGNVETRLEKLERGVAAATLLAAAGLNRLGLAGAITGYLDADAFLPAVAQGAIALQTRENDAPAIAAAVAIGDPETAVAVAAERAFLTALDGSCRTPIGGLARLAGGTLTFRGIIIAPDGSRAHQTERSGNPADAAVMGLDAGDELKRRGGPDFFRS